MINIYLKKKHLEIILPQKNVVEFMINVVN